MSEEIESPAESADSSLSAPPAPAIESLLSRLSPAARNAVSRADRFRRQFSQDRIHMEHLLVGLFDEGSLEERFAAGKIDRRKLADLIGSAGGRRPETSLYQPREYPKPPDFSTHAQEALILAAARAQTENDRPIEPLDLFEGALRITECDIVRALVAEWAATEPSGTATRVADGSGTETLGSPASPPASSAPAVPSELPPTPTPTPAETPELFVRNASAGDQPTEDDRLGFGPYVDAMAGFLLNEETRPPLTVSIEGEWGSGKSSFMLQLEKGLRDRMAVRRREWWKSLGSRLVKAWKGAWRERWTRLHRESHLPASLTVRFNAWRHDKEDALWAAFALDFVQKIAAQRSFLRRWWGHLRLFGLRYSWRTGGLQLGRFLAAWVVFLFLALLLPLALFRGTTGWSSTVYGWLSDLALAPRDQTAPELFHKLGLTGVALYYAVVLVLLQRAKDFLGNPLAADLKKYLSTPDYAGRVAFVEAFHEDFERIVRAYVGNNKVFVFIDDLDRCEVPKAADLMQALNLMIAEDPHLIFLLGMDRKKVAAGLAVKYEKLLPYLAAPDLDGEPEPERETKAASKEEEAARAALRGLDFGYEFLQKFIQLPFRVPAPRPRDLQLFLGSLSGSDAPIEPIREAMGFHDEDADDAPSLPPGVGVTERLVPAQEPAQVGVPPQAQFATPAPQPLVETKKEREERRRDLRVLLGSDSAAVRDAGLMAKLVLGGNPRRLKQFLNLFRLRCYIASETGLFAGDPRRSVTLQQLAKLVSVELAYPGLLFDLGEDPMLLASLQRQALAEAVDGPLQTSAFRRWRRERWLTRLLQFGCAFEVDPYKPQPADYRLDRIPVEILLQTSPRVTPPTDPGRLGRS